MEHSSTMLQSSGNIPSDGDSDRPDIDPGRPEPHSKKQGRTEKCYDVDGIGVLDVITLPPRHLVWISLLSVLGMRMPDLFQHQEFFEGAEQAFRVVFETLAVGDTAPLRGLVDDALLAQLSSDVEASVEENWSTRPSLTHVKLVGLLSAEGVEGEDEGDRKIRITPMIYSSEAYEYASQEVRQVQVQRLQSWTLERKLDGDHWTIVQMSCKRWYSQRSESSSGSSGTSGKAASS